MFKSLQFQRTSLFIIWLTYISWEIQIVSFVEIAQLTSMSNPQMFRLLLRGKGINPSFSPLQSSDHCLLKSSKIRFCQPQLQILTIFCWKFMLLCAHMLEKFGISIVQSFPCQWCSVISGVGHQFDAVSCPKFVWWNYKNNKWINKIMKLRFAASLFLQLCYLVFCPILWPVLCHFTFLFEHLIQ